MLEIINKFKAINPIGTECEFTTEMIAEYFEVPIATVKTSIKRLKRTLTYYDELRILRNEELRDFKNVNPHLNLKGVSAISLLTIDGFVRIGLKLNNQMSYNLKTEIMNYGLPEKFNDVVIHNYKKEKEYKLKKVLYETFNGIIPLRYQVKCGKYFIDYVIGENIAVECDEYGHSNYNYQNEIEREKYITSKGYKIIRYNPDGEDSIFELINRILNTYKVA